MFYFTWQIVSSIQQIFSKQFLVFSRYLANSFQYLADIQQIVSSIQQIFSKQFLVLSRYLANSFYLCGIYLGLLANSFQQFLVFSRYLANSFQYLADMQQIVSSIQQIFSKQFLVFSRYLANSFYLCGICLGLLANSFQQFLLSQEIVSGFYRNGKQRGQGTPQYIQ